MTIDIFKGLFATILLITLISVGFGLTASTTDVFNYNTSAAEARAKDQQTKTDTEKAAIDLELYRQKTQAETEHIRIEAEKQKKQAEIDLAQMQDKYQIDAEQHRIRVQQQLELERIAGFSILGILTLLILILIVGFAYRFLRRERQKSIIGDSIKVATSKPVIDAWHKDLEWKRQQIKLARQREQEMRTAGNDHKVQIHPLGNMSFVFTREEHKSSKDLPLAE